MIRQYNVNSYSVDMVCLCWQSLLKGPHQYAHGRPRGAHARVVARPQRSLGKRSLQALLRIQYSKYLIFGIDKRPTGG